MTERLVVNPDYRYTVRPSPSMDGALEVLARDDAYDRSAMNVLPGEAYCGTMLEAALTRLTASLDDFRAKAQSTQSVPLPQRLAAGAPPHPRTVCATCGHTVRIHYASRPGCMASSIQGESDDSPMPCACFGFISSGRSGGMP